MTSRPPWILGISASHNGALCLLHGDEIVVAIQEERLLRRKRARVFGAYDNLALKYCLDYAKITVKDLDLVVMATQTGAVHPQNDLALNPALRTVANSIPVKTISHHLGHAIGAFATSGFEDAAVLIVDGQGGPFEELSDDEKRAVLGPGAGSAESASLYRASGIDIRAVEKHMVPGRRWLSERDGGMPAFASLGGIFSAASEQIFGDDMEAGKVMGLAPYGTPTIPVEEFFDITEAGFRFHPHVPNRFKHSDRWPKRQKEYEDLAASAQAALEIALLHLARRVRQLSGLERLCYAGGVALNSVANERIVRETGFKEVFIMPAAEDSGPAIGAAYFGLWSLTGRNTARKLAHDSVGRQYSMAEVDAAIAKVPSVRCEVANDVVRETVDLLCKGRIIGWFQGGSELGPRSLGQRSLLCDPRGPEVKDRVNARVKHREGFRPFAPVIPLEHVNEWFDLEGAPTESPFMLRICKFREDKAAIVPAVVHVDGTGRLQTLTPEANGLLYELVRAFHERTGVPILLNTSFNVAGEPIVETPTDALWCLLYTGVDHCVLGDRIVSKKEGYRSLLDLYPYVVAELGSAQLPALLGEMNIDVRSYPNIEHPWRMPCGITRSLEPMYMDEWREGGIPFPFARFLTRTEWGDTIQFGSLENFEVIARCNGKTDGWSLLRALQASGNSPVSDEKGLVRLLGELRRAAILGFREAAC